MIGQQYPLSSPTNDLSSSLRRRHYYFFSRICDSIPPPAAYILIPLFLLGIAVSLFILVAVHNALLLVLLLLLLTLVISFLLWNSYVSTGNGALEEFLTRFPVSDLRTAREGQLVKVTGCVSCGNLSLESSYEKVPRCVYTSTLLYECRSSRSKSPPNFKCIKWNLAYSERFVVDFFITDAKSGMRVMVKAGYNSEVISLINESTLVNTTSKNMTLSSTLMRWLGERRLSPEARLLSLEEGYVKEGNVLTVMGMLSRKDGILMVVPTSELISTGCLAQKLLLPTDFNGLIINAHNNVDSMAKTCQAQNPIH